MCRWKRLMNENELLIKNRLREATVILERANLIICDESWKCDSSRPPFSSFQLVMQGEGTGQYCILTQVSYICSQPVRINLFLQMFKIPIAPIFAILRLPVSKRISFSWFSFLFVLMRKTRKKHSEFFRTLFNPVSRRIFLPLWRPNRLSFICSAIILNAARLEVSLSFHNPLTLHFPVQFPMLKHICMSRLPYNRWQKWPAIIPVTLQNYFKPTWEFLLDSLFCRKKRKLQRCF